MTSQVQIQTLQDRLKEPNEGASLYKIIPSHNFIDMLEHDYLYFRRVDTYTDDKRDSDQLNRDHEINKNAKFGNSEKYSLFDYYKKCRSQTYACCFSLENSNELWSEYSANDPNAVCIIFDYIKLKEFLNPILLSFLSKTDNLCLLDQWLVNYGLVTYGDRESFCLSNSYPPNPVEYAYFKDNEYSLEKECRITLLHFAFHNRIGEKSIKIPFNFQQAIEAGAIEKQIILQENVENEFLDKFTILAEGKKITLSFSQQ